MLYAIIISVILLSICVWATKKLNEKIKIYSENGCLPEEINQLSDFSKLFAIASMVFFGISAGFMFTYGFEAKILFKQNVVSTLWIALSIITIIVGVNVLKAISNQKYNSLQGIVLFLIVLVCIILEVNWYETTRVIEEDVVTKIETVQLNSEIIPNMCIKGEGEVVAFCYVTSDGTGEYDTVPAEQAHIEHVENGGYMETQVKSKIITAIYPDGKIETRVSSTKQEYIFYIEKEK